ncbi:MAG TPA: HDOD domain-containing protein [Steroidobacteraceae bacterium]|jgi:HD-like signal output (HDOD) protein|nr:HDOD domain-containing protein [Steroidobacteraceae bacterium]
MQDPSSQSQEAADDLQIVHDLLEAHLSSNELAVPLLPDVAVRVVRAGSKTSSNAHQLAEIINADPALTMYVLRIAVSAAKRPMSPIVSLQHAVAWLGLDEVSNIAFTLALQGKMLDVKGQQHKARRLWRHSLASALWARQIAHLLSEETGMCYLCGLLHNIGRVVSLGAVHDAALRAGKKLGGEGYDRLIEAFSRRVGEKVIAAWGLPAPVPTVTAHWETYASAGEARFECNVVHVAHRLADITLHGFTRDARDAIVNDQSYHGLGLGAVDAAPLFSSSGAINSELNRYLAP